MSPLALYVGVPIAGGCVAALFAEMRPHVEGLFSTVFNLVHQPVVQVSNPVEKGLRKGEEVRGGLAGMIRQKGPWRIVGALLFLTVFAYFLYADYELLVRTFAEFFAGSGESVPRIARTTAAGIAALIATAGFLIDVCIGKVEIGPWRDLGPKIARVWLFVGIVLLFGLLALQGHLGAWRADQLAMADPSLATTHARFISIATPMIVTVAGVIAGWCIPVTGILIAVTLLTFGLFVLRVLDLILKLVSAVVMAAHAVAMGLLGLFGALGAMVSRRLEPEPDRGHEAPSSDHASKSASATIDAAAAEAPVKRRDVHDEAGVPSVTPEGGARDAAFSPVPRNPWPGPFGKRGASR
jgi:hypothetical protein